MSDDIKSVGPLRSDNENWFRENFADEMYYDPSNEVSPFGNDDGSDALWLWTEGPRAGELTRESTLEDVLDIRIEVDEWLRQMDTDQAAQVVGAGFTLLRLTGQLDTTGRALIERAFAVYEIRFDSPRELAVMRRDIASAL